MNTAQCLPARAGTRPHDDFGISFDLGERGRRLARVVDLLELVRVVLEPLHVRIALHAFLMRSGVRDCG